MESMRKFGKSASQARGNADHKDNFIFSFTDNISFKKEMLNYKLGNYNGVEIKYRRLCE
jgi:hypothetical protein